MKVLTRFVLVAVVVLGFVSSSCGQRVEVVGRCAPSNCSGCCAADNTCVTATTDTACGSKGASCQACLAGTVCSLGACTASFGPGGGTAGGSNSGGAAGGAVGGGSSGGESAGGSSGGAAGGSIGGGSSGGAAGGAISGGSSGGAAGGALAGGSSGGAAGGATAGGSSGGTVGVEMNCMDTIDNDGDHLADCDDSDCAAQCTCTVAGATYAPGTVDPNNVCQTCAPTVSRTRWTPTQPIRRYVQGAKHSFGTSATPPTGWQDEGTVWRTVPRTVAGSVTVYLLRRASTGDDMLSTDPAEGAALGYVNVGALGTFASVSGPELRPVYRNYAAGPQLHLSTVNPSEGLSCCGYTTGPVQFHACPTCPLDMAETNTGACIDRFEASQGTGGRAASVQGAMPWVGLTTDEAETACAAAGKRLCTEAEWQAACQGPSAFQFPYGNTYSASACNGLDKNLGAIVATGTISTCVGGYPGVFDMSGNAYERTVGPAGARIRGGSYRSSASAGLLRCTTGFDFGTSADPAVGFRCCR